MLARLVGEIQAACRESGARIVLHVGRDPPDLKQLSYLPAEAEESGRLRVVRHDVPGHTLGAGLKAAGLLRKTVLGDLLGHSYQLPAAGEEPEATGFLLEGHPDSGHNGVYKLQTEHKGRDGVYQHDLDTEGWPVGAYSVRVVTEAGQAQGRDDAASVLASEVWIDGGGMNAPFSGSRPASTLRK